MKRDLIAACIMESVEVFAKGANDMFIKGDKVKLAHDAKSDKGLVVPKDTIVTVRAFTGQQDRRSGSQTLILVSPDGEILSMHYDIDETIPHKVVKRK